MKKRSIAAILASVAIAAYVNVGCEKKTVSDKNSNAITETVDIPDEVKEKIAAAANMESVPIPENGWTDEALLDTVRINGEKMNFPFTLNDLGDAFTTVNDDYLRIRDGTGASSFAYYQQKIGYIHTYSTSDLDNIANDEIRQFIIKVDDGEPIKGDYPISINGVTIGSDYDEVIEKLGFEPTEIGSPDSNSYGVFSISGRAEDYYVSIRGGNLKVKYLDIAYSKKN